MAQQDEPTPQPAASPEGETVRVDIDPQLLLDNWRGEQDAATLYRSLARHHPSEQQAEIMLEMADVEDRHAEIMARRLKEMGIPLPKYRLGLRTRLLMLLSRVFGARSVLPIVEGMEANSTTAYLGPGQDPAVAALASEEQSHYRVLTQMTQPSGPTEIARHERWHRTGGGGTLRAASFGVNDGRVSNLALVMGFAGAQADPEIVMLAGVAGLLAGASSMGSGEYLSMRAQRELFERQIALEETELLLAPEEERAELVLIYRAKGVPTAEAEQLADRILQNPETALDTLVREELGLDPDALGSPWGAATGSFIAFAAGAIVPVLAYFSGAGWLQFGISAGMSAVALFAVGVGVSLFTGRSALYSGGRQLAIGAVAAAATYGIGTAIGVGAGI